MSEKLEFLYIDPSNNLRDKIITDIDRRIRNKAIFSLFYGGLTSLTSVLVMIYFFVLIVKDFYSSGLREYLSLAFSDYSLLITLWREYLLSVIESLPVISIILVTFSLFIFTLSIKYVVNSFKKIPFISLRFNK